MEQPTTPHDRLKKKINNKKKNRTGKPPDINDSSDIFNMLNQVNQMLKQNPEMVKKVSKSVNSIFENKALMESIVKEIKVSSPDIDQTLASSSVSVCDSDDE
jgi:hypothetical protein